MVSHLRALAPHLPVIGLGGIRSGADACRMIAAGADAVQLYTGLMDKGAAMIAEMNSAVKRHNV
jgi:dihydroorotate dehydrogenase